MGAGAKTFVAIALSPADPGAYALDFGAQMPALSGTGVFLNPHGVLNAASSAPAGNPISPGEFLTLYGTGLAAGSATAKPPYPNSLNGVTVLINNKAAPLYYVSPTQINCLAPFGLQGADRDDRGAERLQLPTRSRFRWRHPRRGSTR